MFNRTDSGFEIPAFSLAETMPRDLARGKFKSPNPAHAYDETTDVRLCMCTPNETSKPNPPTQKRHKTKGCRI